jgi:hypothetical protein
MEDREMTFAQFLARLKKTPRYWRIMPGTDLLRYDKPGDPATLGMCPLERVVNARGPLKAAIKLKLSTESRDLIMTAADTTRLPIRSLNKKMPELRRKLLQACGVKEK